MSQSLPRLTGILVHNSVVFRIFSLGGILKVVLGRGGGGVAVGMAAIF